MNLSYTYRSMTSYAMDTGTRSYAKQQEIRRACAVLFSSLATLTENYSLRKKVLEAKLQKVQAACNHSERRGGVLVRERYERCDFCGATLLPDYNPFASARRKNGKKKGRR
ncbi:MAG: hypothetical protein A3I44_02345 [Candidatus Sungbacteria bacterium RIFCSPLOWO2_02_FULL_51_17]|nr:MAG: hypothetical protein A3B29_02530 [Candidatus Sungbacteria bacterium RIFCSPLOWO2_01_FULL_51_34]OHA12033.1 MAG: hypothetical protein A3I44_02345 [Candidatus Sungbacteria bacterium RIFCSPLOWO2_02_FULL_51_17]